MKVEKSKTAPIESNKIHSDSLNKKIQEIMRVIKKEITSQNAQGKNVK